MGKVLWQVNALARNLLIVVVIKKIVKWAVGHRVAVLLYSSINLKNYKAVPTGGCNHLDLFELINLSSLHPKGCCLQLLQKKKENLSQMFLTLVNESFVCVSGLGFSRPFAVYFFCSNILPPVLMELKTDLHAIRETPRDSVLLPQEHNRQTRKKVFGSAESYAKDSLQYTVYQWTSHLGHLKSSLPFIF